MIKLQKFSMYVAEAWSSSDDNAMCYALPVLRMTSCFHIMRSMGQNQKWRCFVEFAMWLRLGQRSLLTTITLLRS